MIDTTLSSFERDVIDPSVDVPVLVDFWAPWCSPCQSLGPMLERLEREYGGRFRLVKVNADANPELVSSFDLRSVPFSVVFVHGSVVAQFVGAQPEAFVRAFLDRVIPDPGEEEHRSAREALVLGDTLRAEESLRHALAIDPSHDGARLDLMALLLDGGQLAAAKRHGEVLSSRAGDQSNYATVKARMDACEIAAVLPPPQALEQRLALDPADLQARLDLADTHIARRDFAPALDQLLEIVHRDRTFQEDIGRIRMLEVFEMAAGFPELVDAYRGRLAQILF